MRAKMLFSVGVVAGLAGLSVAALAYTPDDHPTKTISHQETAAAIILNPVNRENSQIKCEADGMSWAEAYLLARIAMAEAEGEDTEGKALVMRVVLNRVSDKRFPNSIEAVIYQAGQFSPISDGRFDWVKPDEDCWEALKLIEADQWDGGQGATYFESKSASAWHSGNLEFLFQHGNHYFYKEREG